MLRCEDQSGIDAAGVSGDMQNQPCGIQRALTASYMTRLGEEWQSVWSLLLEL